MKIFKVSIGFVLTLILLQLAIFAQEPNVRDKQKVRTVTIPISIYTKKELREDQTAEIVQADRLTIKENKEEQTILSIRSVSNTPLALAVLIQDDLTGNINLQLKDIAKFITRMPRGTRVMVAYIRGGTLQIRQKFTDDLDKAAKSLRIISGTGAGSNGPYEGVAAALKRFEALPAGRRAVLLISDGVDTSNGTSAASSIQSVDFDRAVTGAQKIGVAIYSFFTPSVLSENGSSQLTMGGQGALNKLSEETGGRAFFQGTIAPISFDPFFKDLDILLGRQFALTYLSTHMKKGYYKIEVASSNPEIKIEHPKGYYHR